MGLSHAPRVITDGLTLALDAAPNPRFSNYKGRSVSINSSGDYLSIADSADLELDTNTTIELFIKFNTIPTVATYIFGKINGYWLAYDSTAVGGVADRFTFAIYNGSSWSGATNASGGFLPVVNTWYHIAVVKEGTSTKLYVDGTLYGSGTLSGTPADNSNVVSISYSGGTIDAEISNVRFIRGTALYTSNFTPPTEPLTAVTNTKLLTCQDTTFTDASSSGHTITPTGNAAISYNGPFSGSGWTDLTNRGNSGTLTNGPVLIQEPKLEPFGGAGAVAFDGSDYLEIPASSDFSFTTAPWTFECWVYHKDWTTGADGNGFQYMLYPQQPSHPSYPVAIAVRQGYYVIVDSANYGSPWSSSYNNIGSYGTAASLNTWNHVAYTRDSSGVDRVFVNGTLQFSATGKTNTSSSISSVARFGGTGTGYINGYISNLRLIKGTALYTANFTPPRKKLEVTSDTVLLTCEKGTIRDRSSSAHAITINGDAKSISGASYFEFDGTDDNCSLGPSSDFTPGTGPFTIEMWIYPTATPSQYEGPAYYTGSGVSLTSLFWAYRSGSLDLINNGDSYTLLSMTYPTLNQWVHLVASRDASGYFAVYENGVVKVSTTGNSDNYEQTEIYIGGSGAYKWPGKVSIFKMYKGKGLTAAEVEQNFNALRGRYGI